MPRQQLNDAQRRAGRGGCGHRSRTSSRARRRAGRLRIAAVAAAGRASARAADAQPVPGRSAQLADGQAALRPTPPAAAIDAGGRPMLADAWAQWQQGADALAAGWGEWQGRQDALSAKAAEWQQNMALWQAAWDANEAHPENPDYAEQQGEAWKPRSRFSMRARTRSTEGRRLSTKLAASSRRSSRRSMRRVGSSTPSRPRSTPRRRSSTPPSRRSSRAPPTWRPRACSADAQIAAAQQQLDEAAAQIASGRSQLEQGRADYEERPGRVRARRRPTPTRSSPMPSVRLRRRPAGHRRPGDARRGYVMDRDAELRRGRASSPTPNRVDSHRRRCSRSSSSSWRLSWRSPP